MGDLLTTQPRGLAGSVGLEGGRKRLDFGIARCATPYGAEDLSPGETFEHVEAGIADLIERCRPADPRLTVDARTILHRSPMETPATAPIVQALVAAAGPGTSLAPMSYWADSAFLAAAGIPTVLYGPEGDGAHADIEWISRSGTSTASTVLTRLAQDFCS
jgi:acetylornithine deacetylase